MTLYKGGFFDRDSGEKTSGQAHVMNSVNHYIYVQVMYCIIHFLPYGNSHWTDRGDRIRWKYTTHHLVLPGPSKGILPNSNKNAFNLKFCCMFFTLVLSYKAEDTAAWHYISKFYAGLNSETTPILISSNTSRNWRLWARIRVKTSVLG